MIKYDLVRETTTSLSVSSIQDNHHLLNYHLGAADVHNDLDTFALTFEVYHEKDDCFPFTHGIVITGKAVHQKKR